MLITKLPKMVLLFTLLLIYLQSFVYALDPCMREGDCNSTQVCSPKGYCLTSCTINSDCAANQFCYITLGHDGICYGTGNYTCSQNEECFNNNCDSNGRCGPSACASSASCPSGKGCSNGYCLDKCTQNYECDSTQNCTDGYCLGLGNFRCERNSECFVGYCNPYKHFCGVGVNGLCDSTRKCKENLECFSRNSTTSKVCLQPCISNANCPFNTVCYFGMCLGVGGFPCNSASFRSSVTAKSAECYSNICVKISEFDYKCQDAPVSQDLLNGQTLPGSQGRFLLHSDTQAHELVILDNGDLQFNYLQSQITIWSSSSSIIANGPGVGPRLPYDLALLDNGQLVMYDADNNTVWFALTSIAQATGNYTLSVGYSDTLSLFFNTNKLATPLWTLETIPIQNSIGTLFYSGHQFFEGSCIQSRNRYHRLCMQSGGLLVFYNWYVTVWSPAPAYDLQINTEAAHPYYATFDSSSGSVNSFKIYSNDANMPALWNLSSLSSSYNMRIVVQENGNLAIYSNQNKLLWQTHTYLAVSDISIGNQLNAGSTMYEGQYLQVVNDIHTYKLILQYDGNLVLYDGNVPLWASGTIMATNTHPYSCKMELNGRVTIYDAKNNVVWYIVGASSGTGFSLRLENDGSLSIYSGNTPVWTLNSLPSMADSIGTILYYSAPNSPIQPTNGKLVEGKCLQSRNAIYRFCVQSGGLAIYANHSLVWITNQTVCSLSSSAHPYYVKLLMNGVFTFNDNNVNPICTFGTPESVPKLNYRLVMNENGNLVVYNEVNEVGIHFTGGVGLYWSNTAFKTYPYSSSLQQGDKLYEGYYLQISNGSSTYQLWMQYDGNVVLYSGKVGSSPTMVWKSTSLLCTQRHPYYLTMQSNGKLVVYDADGFVVWYAIGTLASGSGTYSLQLGTDGSMNIYKGSTQTWSLSSVPVEEGPTLLYADNGILTAGTCIQSRNRLYRLCLQLGNVLVLYDNYQIVYYFPTNSYTGNNSPYTLFNAGPYTLHISNGVPKYGDLYINDASSNKLWSFGKGSSISANYRLVMQDDRNFVMYGLKSALWYSLTAVNASLYTATGTNLLKDVQMYEGQYIQNGDLTFIQQYDGNLVLYTGSTHGTRLWASSTAGDNHNHPYYAILSGEDGNLKIFGTTSSTPIWSTQFDAKTNVNRLELGDSIVKFVNEAGNSIIQSLPS